MPRSNPSSTEMFSQFAHARSSQEGEDVPPLLVQVVALSHADCMEASTVDVHSLVWWPPPNLKEASQEDKAGQPTKSKHDQKSCNAPPLVADACLLRGESKFCTAEGHMSRGERAAQEPLRRGLNSPFHLQL
ncbi:hypothetical protein NDU88_000472 [Pleurodeles waltl]|uniref:Prolactin receptor n=1 Tax=Pleurodeles waltl TaxID=8319 RepID=A0AAV7MJ02_PLEWA|nr:hypothetical protein NDU88_000472 [Pleurodeles waltl]